MSLKLKQQGLILVIVPLLFELIFVSSLTFLWYQSKEQVRQEAHSREIVVATNELSILLIDGVSNLLLYRVGRAPGYEERFNNILNELPARFQELKSLTSQNSYKRDAAAKIISYGENVRKILKEVKKGIDKLDQMNSNVDKYYLIMELEKASQDFNYVANKLISEERELAKETHRLKEKTDQVLIFVLSIGVCISILLSVLLALSFHKRTVKRLNVLIDNSRRMALGDELATPLAGDDEIAQLDSVFHKTANSLEESEIFKAQVRKTISHDLMTPLTSVKSFLSGLGAGIYGEVSKKTKDRALLVEETTAKIILLIEEFVGFDKQLSQIDQQQNLIVTIDRALKVVQKNHPEKKFVFEKPLETIEVNHDRSVLVEALLIILTNLAQSNNEVIALNLRAEADHSLLTINDKFKLDDIETIETFFQNGCSMDKLDNMNEEEKGRFQHLDKVSDLIEKCDGSLKYEVSDDQLSFVIELKK